MRMAAALSVRIDVLLILKLLGEGVAVTTTHVS